jgi:hypothetical protein
VKSHCLEMYSQVPCGWVCSRVLWETNISPSLFVRFGPFKYSWRTLTHISNADQRSSAPDLMDRFSRWTHMIDSEIDLALRMLFGYWQFSVLRKIGRAWTFSPSCNYRFDFRFDCLMVSLRQSKSRICHFRIAKLLSYLSFSWDLYYQSFWYFSLK